MKRLRKLACIALVLTTFAGLFCGCNTVRGVGEDIEAGGRAIKKSAE